MSTLSGSNNRFPRSCCSTLLLHKPESTKQTTMSPLTLLTATVVVVGLGCWVPTGAYYFHHNPRMLKCNRAAMPVVSLNMPQFLEGRWYVSHSTSNMNSPLTGVIYDIKLSAPLAEHAYGLKQRDVLWIRSTHSQIKRKTCATTKWANPIVGNRFYSLYTTWYYPKFGPGLHVSWIDTHVIATDYSSTVVFLSEVVINGKRDIRNSAISVVVRDPAFSPNAYVVDAALHGFCTGDFLDLSSNYYISMSKSRNLPCFNAFASVGVKKH